MPDFKSWVTHISLIFQCLAISKYLSVCTLLPMTFCQIVICQVSLPQNPAEDPQEICLMLSKCRSVNDFMTEGVALDRKISRNYLRE